MKDEEGKVVKVSRHIPDDSKEKRTVKCCAICKTVRTYKDIGYSLHA